ncbi:hypothetical protein BS50DRAFT_624507 [Corynespora cassiicola Philippines]|uniref:Nephrocystin 3-like N-terminal domain-containing protein n=1 Tax=Corynespora cassiicola Philippines TaxID=1448308 RepID=A0A2T2NCB4_CORCC|nr:hypothetical protein BS50DRAFT_624507 [Corynespora cassiicola Philippines]
MKDYSPSFEGSGSAGAFLHSQPAAVDFIDNRLPEYHPIFRNPPARFDPVSGRYIAAKTPAPMHRPQRSLQSRPGPGNVDSMPFWNSIFPDAMDMFRNLHKAPVEKREYMYTIRDKRSWAEVKQQLESAKELYSSTAKPGGWARQSWRTLADNSQSAVQASKFVPNGEMTSPVFSIVQHLFETIRHAAKVREESLKGIKNLEVIFADLDLNLTMYPEDENISRASISLVATILKAVETFIGFYISHSLRRAGSAIFKGDEYGAEMTECLENVKEKSEELIHQAQNSQNYGMLRHVHVSERGQRKLIEDVRTIQIDCSEVRCGMIEMKDVMNTVLSLLDEHQRARDEQLKKVTETQNLAASPFRRGLRNVSPTPGISHLYRDSTNSSPMRANITPESLWNLVNIPEIEKDDMDYIEVRQERLPQGDRARAEHMVRTERFKRWISSLEKDLLLIHGDCSSSGNFTALSWFCCTISRAVKQRDNFVVLLFFCSRHDEDDLYFGCRSLLRSFISQLLCQHPFDTRTLHDQIDLVKIEDGDIEELCVLFDQLIRQLSAKSTVICLVDGLGYYERDAAVEDALQVFAFISHMIHDQSILAIFKVLALSPVPVRALREFFQGESFMGLPSTSAAGGTASRLRMSRQLDESFEAAR